MTDTTTRANEIRDRLNALVRDPDLGGRCMGAVCAVAELMVSGGQLDSLDAGALDGLEWLLGHAELDNGVTWCGRWHV